MHITSLAPVMSPVFSPEYKKKNLFLPTSITLTHTYNGAFDKVNHHCYQPFETEHHWKCSLLVWVLQHLMEKKTCFHRGEGCLNHPSKPLEYPWDRCWTPFSFCYGANRQVLSFQQSDALITHLCLHLWPFILNSTKECHLQTLLNRVVQVWHQIPED